MDDQTAISRIKQGDLTSLEILVNRYQIRAVYSAYLVVYDRAVAEDVAQMAFLKVVEHIHQFDEARPFAPWFFRIVLNDSIKAAKRYKQHIALDEEVDGPVIRLAGWLTDPAPEPWQILEQKETSQLVLKAIQSLSPEQRAVVVMRYFLEMSEADMSNKMDRPLSTIKWWLRKARKRLRHRIGSSHGFEDSQ